MVGTWRCIATGTTTIRSMIRSETRCWEWSGPLPLFLPRPVVRGRGHSLHGALLNALLWDQTHNFNDLRHVLRNVLNHHLRLAIWSQPPKITILGVNVLDQWEVHCSLYPLKHRHLSLHHHRDVCRDLSEILLGRGKDLLLIKAHRVHLCC